MEIERPGRLRVGVIGVGRVGAVLGAALDRVGHRVVAVSAISETSRARAAQFLPTAEVMSPQDVVKHTDLVLLTVPDDALPSLAENLEFSSGQIVVHTAGAHGLAVLAPAARRHALPLALHPVMTFTNRTEDLDRLMGISWGVTAPEELRLIAEALVLELGGEPEFVSEADRPLYHAAIVHGANHLITLVNEAVDLLRQSGVTHAERALAPLLSASLDNSLRLKDAALTGPVARGDANTVSKHLSALKANAPEAVGTYLALARRTADRALASGRLKPADAEKLLGVLAAGS